MLTKGAGTLTPLGQIILIFFWPIIVISNVSSKVRFQPYSSMRLSPGVGKDGLTQEERAHRGAHTGTPLGQIILIFFWPFIVISNVSSQVRFHPYSRIRLSSGGRKVMFNGGNECSRRVSATAPLWGIVF